MKTCTKCHKEKPLTEYSKKGRGDRLRADCRDCNKAYNKQIYPKYIESRRIQRNKECKMLNDWYVKKSLKQNSLPTTPELIELKRLQLITKRLCKKTSKN